jgi:lysophospholipase
VHRSERLLRKRILRYLVIIGLVAAIERRVGDHIKPADLAVAVARRALPNAPKGYAPAAVDCPGGSGSSNDSQRPSVRGAASLSPEETAWLDSRRAKTESPMRDLLKRLKIGGFDVDAYLGSGGGSNDQAVSALPNIAISFSGGGYRALQVGAGVMAAFDSRTENATSMGHLGGLLQSTTYVSGLSGGAWLTGSIFVNNFTSVTALRDDTAGSVWNFANSILEGPEQGGIQVFDKVGYYQSVADTVSRKATAGFETTLTDFWGRGLSFQLVNATEGGPAVTWSSIALTEAFQNGDMPMPIVLAVEREPDMKLISRTTSVYEFNPFEMGTWDPTAFGFVPMQYLGSEFKNGSIPDGTSCVAGFDNVGFIMGTSSSLFNAVLTAVGQVDAPKFLKDIISAKVTELSGLNEDIADYPNPFFDVNEASNPSAKAESLRLVDGGLDFQNIPLHPVIQPVRNVDVIFAVDSSGDTEFSWPNGTALVTTYERSLAGAAIANGTRFPSIPDVNTMVNLGLNSRPTFFGCNSSNITDEYVVPLVVYIPNSPYSSYTNFSTFQPQAFDDSLRNANIQNGYDIATMGNASINAEWPACVGCAILSRSLGRTGTPVPEVCAKCFQQFCWDGSLNSTVPANYEPVLRFEQAATSSAAAGLARGLPASMASTVLGAAIAAFVILMVG